MVNFLSLIGPVASSISKGGGGVIVPEKRFYKVGFTGNRALGSSDAYYTVARLDLLDEFDASIIDAAAAPTFSATSTYSGSTEVGNLFDGNPSTNWASTSMPSPYNRLEEITIDLHEIASAVPAKILLQASSSSSETREFPDVIEVSESDDGVSWTSILSYTDAGPEPTTGEIRTELISPPPSWVTVEDITLNEESNGWGGYTGRVVVDSSVLEVPSTKIRLTIESLSSQPMTCDEFWIGKQSGTIGFESAPTEITWGGLVPVSLASNEEIVSDPISLIFDPGTDAGLVISFFRSSGDPGSGDFSGRVTQSGWSAFSKLGRDVENLSPSGYSEGTRNVVAIKKIEFLDET